MKTSDAGIAAIRLLEALNEATDVFPPLKSAVGSVLHIAKLVKVRLSLKYPPLRDLLVRRKYSGISLEQESVDPVRRIHSEECRSRR